MSNINQMVELVTRDGYVIAQEYLPDAAEGDTRLFLMNGMPLRHKGQHWLLAAHQRLGLPAAKARNKAAEGRCIAAAADLAAARAEFSETLSECLRITEAATGEWEAAATPTPPAPGPLETR